MVVVGSVGDAINGVLPPVGVTDSKLQVPKPTTAGVAAIVTEVLQTLI